MRARGARLVARWIVWLAGLPLALVAGAALLPAPAAAGYFPMYASWPQPGGPGSPISLTYSFSNLLDGGMLDSSTGGSFDAELMRSAFERALLDYAVVLPINFIEIQDRGPLPETGDYDPLGLADIRIGQVPHVDGANAYAYFPTDVTSGLSGDIVFNAQRFGYGWTPTFFYAVAQHELGHSLGMGHWISDGAMAEDPPLAQESLYEGPIFPLSPETVEALQGVYGAGTGSVTPIPEPATALQLGLGLWLLSRCRRRDGR